MQNSLLNNKNLKNRYKEYKPLKKKKKKKANFGSLALVRESKNLKRKLNGLFSYVM